MQLTSTKAIETPRRAERLLAKPTLRRLGEFAITGVLGRVPRRMRREAARRYASAAWRELNGLPPMDPRANKQIVQWIVKQFKDIKDAKAVDGAESPANDVGSSAVRPAERSPEVSFVTPTED